MLEDIFQIPTNEVSTVSWQGDPLYYDLQLYQLGEGHEEFWILNPEYSNSDLRFFIEEIPKTRKCVVFTYDGDWVVKLFKDGWYPYHGYETVEINVPRLVWTRNQDIDSRMTFDFDPRLEYKLEYWDKNYELCWNMDPRFFPHEGEVWVYKAKAIGCKTSGKKFMGTVTPSIKVTYNQELDFLNLNTDDLLPAYYDLDNECVFILDQEFTGREKIEVSTISPAYKKPVGRKVVGIVSPDLTVEVNPKLKNVNFDLTDEKIHYKDLRKEHTWMLDDAHLGPDDKDMWAVKVKPAGRHKGKIIAGTIKPTLVVETNSELPELDFSVDYKIPWYDLQYEHVWMLDSKHTVNAPEPIWAIKVTASDNLVGTKIIGSVSPNAQIEINGDVTAQFNVPDDFTVQYHDFAYEHVWVSNEGKEKIWLTRLRYIDEVEGIKEIEITDEVNFDKIDVIFISYGEPNAEENWTRVLEKAPWAKRVDNVTGLLQAHKQAAKIARTEMFFVVDGDAYLSDDWTFNFQPSLFDRDCSFVWYSKNPINNLVYGYGGVKLLSKQLVKQVKKIKDSDLFKSISPNLKVLDAVSNYTNFNTDEYSTWRSAFRECAKLSIKDDAESKSRLLVWLTAETDAPYSKWAVLGAKHGKQYAEETPTIPNINNYNWLRQQFDKLAKSS